MVTGLTVSSRGQVPPFIVMDVLRAANHRAAAGDDVLHLEIGQPGTPAPLPVRDAAAAMLAAGPVGYTDAVGIPDLRRRIADHYRTVYGCAVAGDRIAVTAGSSAGFVLGFLAAFDPGARVGLAEPGYPAYRTILAALGIKPVGLPVGPADHFQPTVGVLEAYRRAGGARLSGLIVASPSNPTGTVMAAADLRALAAYCRDAGIRLISDEIYHGISFGAETATAAAMTDTAIIINSFSKYYCMTGWRLGWMVLPPDLIRPVECLAQNLFISPSALSQHAAVAAFDCRPDLDARVEAYGRNRAILLSALRDAGMTGIAPSDGAFYLYADVARWTDDSVAFCRRMLDEIGVAAAPGLDFDPGRGGRTVRFSFAAAEADIRDAADRLRTWLAR